MSPNLESAGRLVAVQLGLKRGPKDDRFVEEAGAESSDIVNRIAAAWDGCRIAITEEEIPGIETVGGFFQALEKKVAAGSG